MANLGPGPDGRDRGWAGDPAAQSLARIDVQLGRPLQITEAGRTYDRQAYLRAGYEQGLAGFAFALPPDPPDGPSIHQLGNAIDTDEWVNEVVLALLEDNGWVQTALGRREGWHLEYFPDRDHHRDDLVLALGDDGVWRVHTEPAPEEDDMTGIPAYSIIRDPTNAFRYLSGPLRSIYLKPEHDDLLVRVLVKGGDATENERGVVDALKSIVTNDGSTPAIEALKKDIDAALAAAIAAGPKTTTTPKS